jgi:tRNA-dihydrouridine synthase 2
VRPLPEVLSKKQQRALDERGRQVIFRTCPAEQPVVFQLGTANAELALRAAQMVSNDVSAIEVNMGCPKHFSVSGGMGAALLSAPENARQILTTLTRSLSLPITCKLRMLKTVEETIQFCRMVEECGVSAITVHARNIKERPRDPARWKDLAPVFSAISVPTFANGDVFCHGDIQRIK